MIDLRLIDTDMYCHCIYIVLLLIFMPCMMYVQIDLYLLFLYMHLSINILRSYEELEDDGFEEKVQCAAQETSAWEDSSAT